MNTTYPTPIFFAGRSESQYLVWDACRVEQTWYYFLFFVDPLGLTIQDLAQIKGAPREIVSRLSEYRGAKVKDLGPLLASYSRACLLLLSVTADLQVEVIAQGDFHAYLVRPPHYAEIISPGQKQLSGQFRSEDKLLMVREGLDINQSLMDKITREGLNNEVLAELSAQTGSGVLGITLPSSKTEKVLAPAEVAPPVPPTGLVVKPVAPRFGLKIRLVAGLDWLIGKLNRQEIFVKKMGDEEEGMDRKKHTLFLVGIMIVILFGASVIFGSISQKNKTKKLAVDTTLTGVMELLNEAEMVGVGDPGRARELYQQARQMFAGLEGQKGTESVSVRFEQIQKAVTREYPVSLSNFIDLNLVEEGFNPDLNCFSKGRLYLGRKNLGTGVVLAVDTKKKEQEFKYSGLNEGERFICYQDKLFLTRKNEVLAFANGLFTPVLAIDRDGFVFGAFGTNLYAIDAPNSLVYRYPGTSEGYGEHSLWLQTGQKLDLSDTTGFGIDGSLWIGGEDGRVLKLTQGRLASFNNLEFGFQMSVTALVVDEDLNGVYIADEKQGLLTIFDKEGMLQAVYQDEKLKNKKLVAVSETNRKAIFQTGSQLEALELVH